MAIDVKRLAAALTKRERQIMDIVYQRGSATAADVMAELPGRRSDSTVRTQLRVLEQKGHLRHHEKRLRYVYTTVIPRATARAAAVRHVLHTFFDGSVAQLLRAVVADAGESIPEDLHDRLAVVLDQFEQESGRSTTHEGRQPRSGRS